MKRILAIVIFVAAVSSLASCQVERQQTEKSNNKGGAVEQELINLEKRLSEAFLNKDIGTMKSIMADDIVIIYGDGSRGTRADDIASIGVDEQIESNDLDDFQVRVHGDIAVVMLRLTAKGIRHGKHFNNAKFRYIDVFERRDGRWQCVITQNTHVGKVEL